MMCVGNGLYYGQFQFVIFGGCVVGMGFMLEGIEDVLCVVGGQVRIVVFYVQVMLVIDDQGIDV